MTNEQLLKLAILKLLDQHDANFYVVAEILHNEFMRIVERAEAKIKTYQDQYLIFFLKKNKTSDTYTHT